MQSWQAIHYDESFSWEGMLILASEQSHFQKRKKKKKSEKGGCIYSQVVEICIDLQNVSDKESLLNFASTCRGEQQEHQGW